MKILVAKHTVQWVSEWVSDWVMETNGHSSHHTHYCCLDCTVNVSACLHTKDVQSTLPNLVKSTTTTTEQVHCDLCYKLPVKCGKQQQQQKKTDLRQTGERRFLVCWLVRVLTFAFGWEVSRIFHKTGDTTSLSQCGMSVCEVYVKSQGCLTMSERDCTSLRAKHMDWRMPTAKVTGVKGSISSIPSWKKRKLLETIYMY